MAVKHATIKAPGNTLAAVADWNANHTIDAGTITSAQTNFADQDVKTTSSPEFANLTITDGGFTGIGSAKWIYDDTNGDISTTGNVGIGTDTPTNKFDLTTGDTTSSGFHFGIAINEGGYLTSLSDNAIILSGGMEYITGNWTARSTQASMTQFNNGQILLKCDTGLTDGNTFTPTTIFTITETGINLTNGKEFIRGSFWVTKVINFNDASPATVFDLNYQHIVENIQAYVSTTWDGTGTVNIGDEDDADGFMTDAQLAKGSAGQKGQWGSEHGAYLFRIIGGAPYIYGDFATKRYYGSKTLRAAIVPGTSTKGSMTIYAKITRIS